MLPFFSQNCTDHNLAIADNTLAVQPLDASLARAANAGGSVLMAKTDIDPQGFIALVRDTEGNVVGLHAPR